MSAAATSSRPVLETAGGAGGTRTPGQRIMRGMLPSVMRATCTDAMHDSYECTKTLGLSAHLFHDPFHSHHGSGASPAQI